MMIIMMLVLVSVHEDIFSVHTLQDLLLVVSYCVLDTLSSACTPYTLMHTGGLHTPLSA